jgi:hypothetical protein
VNLGTPQQVFEGEYSIPQALNINPPGLTGGFWDWPTFDTPFEFNGINNLVFDAAVAGGNNCQILRVAFIPGAAVLFADLIHSVVLTSPRCVEKSAETESGSRDPPLAKRRPSTATGCCQNQNLSRTLLVTPVVRAPFQFSARRTMKVTMF